MNKSSIQSLKQTGKANGTIEHFYLRLDFPR